MNLLKNMWIEIRYLNFTKFLVMMIKYANSKLIKNKH